MTIDKTFDPAAIEARWYAHWEASGAFRPARPDAAPFTIVMPPPNVTGSLHLGHALDNTLQDILVRHARLKGKDALWVVGTDHAGIATQMVVERQLALHQQKRTDFSRDEFVEKVWNWKAESGGQITRQLRRLGASCDWSREQFTMDLHFSRAVTHVFVELHRRGLLYRDKRLVNWDPAFQTAISDLEVETREVPGKFWHLRYPFADGCGHISVATTRPETMLADMAVAVHPEDPRYREMVGKMVRLPITGREIPIIADEHADPELGSGAVKITPGHDFDDFEVGVRAGIKPADMLNMLDAKAAVTQTADGKIPADLIGLDRFAARERVVALIEAEGALEKIEDRAIQLPLGDRSGAVIEPWLTDQWYVDAKTLAGPALEAVRSGAIRMVPETWKRTFYNWLENIQPWCVSRQLWWGHRIPAWYGPEKDFEAGVGNAKCFVGFDESEVREQAAAFYALPAERIVFDQNAGLRWLDEPDPAVALWRDEDVLDTWFSSALWPFATLGWPGENPPRDGEGDNAKHGGGGSPHAVRPAESPLRQPSGLPPPRAGEELLRKHYPNDVLISGFDILFFWDARMIMQGLQFMDEVPFRTLYLHGLVRAPDGSKMSKSKGNTVDPLGLIDRYGADALRFTLAAMESQGRDIKLDERRVEGYRNFATKLWNAARFAQGQGIGGATTLEAPRADLPVNRWIIGETIRTVQALDLALAHLRFDEAAKAIYHFVWDRFCDWYLELIKGALSPSPSGEGLGWGLSAPPGLSIKPTAPTPVPSPKGEGLSDAAETRAVAGWVLDQILVMLHPFMPFVTEDLWHALAESSPAQAEPVEASVVAESTLRQAQGERGSAGGFVRSPDLILARWPVTDARAIDPEADAEIEWFINLVREIRSARTEFNVAVAARTDLAVSAEDSPDGQRVSFRFDLEPKLKRFGPALARMARIENIYFALAGTGFHAATATPAADKFVSRRAFQIVVDHVTYAIPLEGVIDLAAERARLEKSALAAEKDRDALAARLANASFVERAKPEAVEKARADHAERSAEAERLRAALARLG